MIKIKFFISHKNEDEFIALKIKLTLKLLNIDAYLDLLDSNITNNGKALTDHIKNELNNCTDIIVVISENTRFSQWVPFEIGMSAQIDMPTATYLHEDILLPSFLSYWPRLRKLSDIDEYISARDKISKSMNIKYGCLDFEARNKTETEWFYQQLKSQLKQK